MWERKTAEDLEFYKNSFDSGYALVNRDPEFEEDGGRGPSWFFAAYFKEEKIRISIESEQPFETAEEAMMACDQAVELYGPKP